MTATPDPVFTDTLDLDLSTRRALAGRPQAPAGPRAAARVASGRPLAVGRLAQRSSVQGSGKATARAPRSKARSFDLGHGDVVIAAITSCTNTSNPSVLIAAGLLARKARSARA